MKYVCPTMENFRKLAGEMDVVLFGAGQGAMRFMNRIGGLIDRLRCILDSDEDKWGGALYGLPIVSPDHLKTMDADKTLVVIVVAGSAVIDVHKQILAMGDYAIMAARIHTASSFCGCGNLLYPPVRTEAGIRVALRQLFQKYIS